MKNMETARLLFATAFASATPIHLSESVTGSPEAAEVPEQRTTWESLPVVVRELRPIYKGNAERSAEKPMRYNVEVLYGLKQQHDEQLSRQQEQLDHLFQVPLLDLANLHTVTTDERQLLTSIIDGCLNSPVREYTLSDGTLVTLLNPDERDYVALSASDGVLLLPCYRLLHRSVSGS
jgi:hypothetical protein